ncbi:TonB-dependent receptor domain-containing protein [Dokdonia ponticola]|uniref:TonB-dependent receptor domain-containing protein n=1 Tax=Dokdonia ponticola TaxID=2041041 RepID=A0ABV9HXT3_9FLAO
MKKISFLIIVSLLPFFSFSQNTLQGVIKEKDTGVSIAFANVILRDNSQELKGGTVSDELGAFSIVVPSGEYELTVSFLGYETWTKKIDIQSDMKVEDIIIIPASEGLDEVIVTGQRKMIEYKADRLVFNVDNNISATGGDAMSVLNVAPGLVVQNGNISLLGKGSSRIMINGRIVELSGDDLTNYLNSISASDIKSVEIITNPPAKYDAAGDGGLININLKKGVRDSWKNTTSLVYDQNTFNFYTLRNNFFYDKNKFRLSLSTSARTGDVRNQGDLDIFFPTGPWILKGDEKEKRDNVTGRVTLDYDVSDNTTIGAQYSGNYSTPDGAFLNNIAINNTSNQIESFLITDGFKDRENRGNSYNVHTITKLDTLGREISVDVDYFDFNSKTSNTFLAQNFTPDFQLIDTDLSAINASDQDITNFSTIVDIEHPLEFVNLSYGGKISFINSESDIEFFNTTSGTPILDTNQSNTFEYEENNQAIYVSGSKNINKKLSAQVGLRLENTQTKGFSRTLNQTTENDYVKLFPTVYLSYQKSDNHGFNFNYGKRINRPSFVDLNPFRVYINSTSFSEGNPFLQPSFSDNFDFTYVFKRKLRINAFLNVATDGFGVVFAANTDDNTQIITKQNYFKEYYFGLGTNYTNKWTSWWKSRNLLYVLGSDTQFENGINATPINSAQLFFSTNNTFSLGGTTKLQVDYMYSSSYERGLYEFGYMSGLNIGLSKSFLNKDLQVTLLVNDVFNSAFLRDFTSNVNGVTQVYNENNSSRFLRLSLSYSFGNNKINVRERAVGNQEEKGRSGN